MRVIYRGIDLMPITTHYFDIESVYDDSQTDYLFTRVAGVWEGIVNAQQVQVNGPFMSYDFSGSGQSDDEDVILPSPRIPPGPVPGPFPPISTGLDVGIGTSPLRSITRVANAPLLTHQVVRQRLMMPRGKLYIFDGPGMEGGGPIPGTDGLPIGPGVVCIQSPNVGTVCDCRNGPKTHVFNLIEVRGDNTSTFSVIWGVETYINEAAKNNINPRGALLSNRFSQSHNIDDEGWTTVTTDGTAIFRTDLVYAQSLSPDALRAQLFLPVSNLFTRVINECRGLEDATGVKYNYTDTQQKVNFVGGPFIGAARISAVQRQAIVTNQDILAGALTTYERILGIRANKNIAKDEAAKPRVPARIGIPGVRPPVLEHNPLPGPAPALPARLKGGKP